MMAISRATICLFCLVASAPLEAEAAGLRARGPERSSNSGATSERESPADIEDAEDELDSDQPAAVDQPVVAQLLMQAALPEEVTAMAPQPSHAAPLAAVRWTAPAAVPKLPVAEPEAVFQFSPPRMNSVVLPPGVAPKVTPPSDLVAQGQHTAAARTLPSWLQSNASSQEAMPPNWPPSGDKYKQCDPPCIQGRGFCNDNVCFCRSPYSGSTCQHKTTDLYRAPKIMVVGFAVTCFVLGIVMSKIIFSFSEHAIETRLQRYGRGKQRFEMWQPPEDKSKAKTAPAKKLDTGM